MLFAYVSHSFSGHLRLCGLSLHYSASKRLYENPGFHSSCHSGDSSFRMVGAFVYQCNTLDLTRINQLTGVYANLTIELYRTLDSNFFRVYGAFYSVVTLILWIGVSTRTVMLVKNRRIFEAPCLEDMDNLMYDFKKRSGRRNKETDESRSRSSGRGSDAKV